MIFWKKMFQLMYSLNHNIFIIQYNSNTLLIPLINLSACNSVMNLIFSTAHTAIVWTQTLHIFFIILFLMLLWTSWIQQFLTTWSEFMAQCSMAYTWFMVVCWNCRICICIAWNFCIWFCWVVCCCILMTMKNFAPESPPALTPLSKNDVNLSILFSADPLSQFDNF